MARVINATASPYPIAFDGSTIRFGLALFSLLSLSIVALMTWLWMCREIWLARKQVYPWESLFAVRMIFTAISFATLIRCGPEAAYMLSYRESSPETIGTILAVKRYCDAFALLPGLTWISLIWAFYVQICAQLTSLREIEGPVLRPSISRPQFRRMATALALTFAISALVAIGKR